MHILVSLCIWLPFKKALLLNMRECLVSPGWLNMCCFISTFLLIYFPHFWQMLVTISVMLSSDHPSSVYPKFLIHIKCINNGPPVWASVFAKVIQHSYQLESSRLFLPMIFQSHFVHMHLDVIQQQVRKLSTSVPFLQNKVLNPQQMPAQLPTCVSSHCSSNDSFCSDTSSCDSTTS